ncbi:MAG: ATP-binding protein [Chloroflexi bacterium]|nr:ATP-binding protein [Chloroflexota bacterium]
MARPTWARVTPLPLPNLRARLIRSLRHDWEVGVYNLNQVLAFSLQFVPAVDALNAALDEMPAERLLPALARLAQAPYDWDLLRFASADLRQALRAKFVDGLRFRRTKDEFREPGLRFDTPPRAAAAGFYLLHAKDASQAAQAFERVAMLPHGPEMLALSRALAAAAQARTWEQLAALADDETFLRDAQTPARREGLLYPQVWQALERLRRVALDARTVQRSVSRLARSQALNRALGELTALREGLDAQPELVRPLLNYITKAWQKVLLSVAGEVGQARIREPVPNPYVVGDPVVGPGFRGREDIMRDLEAIYGNTLSPPSVVLYGHRRMGKTSILRNLGAHLGAQVTVVYVNLLSLGDLRGGMGQLFLALADAIHDALSATLEPDPESFEARPYRAFKRYLRAVRTVLDERYLLLALDELEQLEAWITAGRAPRDLLGVLRSSIQMDPHIAFIFAGLHTLAEMTQDYFEPFFASVKPIRVSFFTREATFQVLANPPLEDFPLDYDPEALERVWQLTGGQPYLVQLVGHLLVDRFNRLAFEQGQESEPVFTVEDVDTVVNDPAFYEQGRYYFSGVWGQAAQGPAGQQTVLRALAPHPEGLDEAALAAATGLDPATLAAALDALARHDVLRRDDSGRWHFTVELMRRWVAQGLMNPRGRASGAGPV